MSKRLRYDPNHDYYAALGVTASASLAEIQRAFREQAKTLHPDRNPDNQAWATAAFQYLNEAYAVLTDPERRRQYDKLRWPHVPHGRSRGCSPGRATGTGLPWWEERYPPRTPPSSRQTRSGESSWAWPNKPPPPPPPEPFILEPFHTLGRLLRGPFAPIYALIVVFVTLFFLSAIALDDLADGPARLPRDQVPGPGSAFAMICDPAVTITSPADGANVTSTFNVLGSAADEDFRAYYVDLIPVGDDSDSTGRGVRLGSVSWTPVVDGLLMRIANLPSTGRGDYVLRLRVQLTDGQFLPPCERRVRFG